MIIRNTINKYRNTISNSRVYVVYDEGTDYTYTGEAITPKVTVYYGNASDISKAKKNKETDGSVLTGKNGKVIIRGINDYS